MIQIETNIPLPTIIRASRGSKYPFADMKVGDSFACETKPASMRSIATGFAKKEGGTVKFAIRGEANGSRVWRVA